MVTEGNYPIKEKIENKKHITHNSYWSDVFLQALQSNRLRKEGATNK